jgi:ATP-dependent DNA helicase PIF1
MGIPASAICQTPIDEISGRDRIFAMAFPTLYPTGQADYNTPRLRNVSLQDYAGHLLCWHDGRFGRHPRWRFLIFNMILRERAKTAARFHVSKESGLQDLTREELVEALDTDPNLLPRIVHQGACLAGTRPYWRNPLMGLEAMARFLSPAASPVFVTFSCADMQ